MARKKWTTEEALARLQQLCSIKEYCKYDLSKKLNQWGIEDGTAILARLEEDKFLDEQRYAQAYVNDKWKFSKWGRQKISYALRGKQIPENYVAIAFSDMDEEAYREMIKAEVNKKRKSLKADDPYKFKQKLYRFSQSRGYEMDIVSEVLDF